MAAKNRIEIVIGATDKASSVLGGVGKALGGIGKIAAGASVAVVGAAAGIGVALGGLAISAAPLEGIGMAFDKMSTRVGLSLDDLREAAGGTVSDFELMRKANLALTGAGDELGKEFGKNLPRLLEAARAAAKATGQDVDFLFESLVTGVKRGSPMLIDNTGLVVKLGEANEAMAAQLGKSVEELTAEEKSIALLNATLKAGERMVEEFGGGALTSAERLAQFRATIQNTKDQIGLAMLPALQALMEPLGDLAEKVGPQVVDLAKRLGEWLGENLPIAIEKLTALLRGEMPGAFGAILDAGRSVVSWFTENWPLIQEKFLEVWTIIEPIALAIVDIFVNQVWPALQSAFNNLTEVLNNLGLDWGDVWGAIGQAIIIVAAIIGGVIVVLIAVLTSIITTMATVLEYVTSVLSDMTATFMKGLDGICKIVGGAMAIVKGIFSGDTDLILEGIRAFSSGIVELIVAMGEGMINVIKLTFGTIVTAVLTFVNTIINFFLDLANTLVGGSIVQDMMTTMLDIIVTGLNAIIGAFVGAAAAIIDTFVGLGVQLADIITGALAGVVSGIQDQIGGLIDAISGAVGDAVGAAEDVLGMGSPSRVFMGIGRNMMEGMAAGIWGARGLPMGATIGVAQGVSRTTNNYFNLTVHSRAETSPVIESFEMMKAIA